MYMRGTKIISNSTKPNKYHKTVHCKFKVQSIERSRTEKICFNFKRYVSNHRLYLKETFNI